MMSNPDFKWKQQPLIQVWRKESEGKQTSSVKLESYSPTESIDLFEEALRHNEVQSSSFNSRDTNLNFSEDARVFLPFTILSLLLVFLLCGLILMKFMLFSYYIYALGVDFNVKKSMFLVIYILSVIIFWIQQLIWYIILVNHWCVE